MINIPSADGKGGTMDIETLAYVRIKSRDVIGYITWSMAPGMKIVKTLNGSYRVSDTDLEYVEATALTREEKVSLVNAEDSDED